jgi:hypothetical protein
MSLPSESPISSTVQRPIGDVVGTEVDVVGDVVVAPPDEPGLGAPVENRHPAPGGLNAVMLMMGGGRVFDGPACVVGVVGVVDVAVPTLVVVPDVVVVVVVVACEVVVASAAGEWCSSFSWKPTMTRADTQSPSPTRKGQLGPAP